MYLLLPFSLVVLNTVFFTNSLVENTEAESFAFTFSQDWFLADSKLVLDEKPMPIKNYILI